MHLGKGIGPPTLQRICGENALSARMRRFRRDAGCITWNPKLDSDVIKRFMDQRLNDEAWKKNSTKALEDLSKAEKIRYVTLNHGRRSDRARPTATQESKAAYKASVSKNFEEPNEPLSSQETFKEDLAQDKTGNKRGKSAKGALTKTGGQGRRTLKKRKFEHCVATPGESDNGGAQSDIVTHNHDGRLSIDEEEADATRPGFVTANHRLYNSPVNEDETAFIRQLLRPAFFHFYIHTGHFPLYAGSPWIRYTPTKSYVQEHQSLRDALQHDWTARGGAGAAPELLRLEECSDDRAVWNMQWDEKIFLEKIDFKDIAGRVIFRRRSP